MKVYLDCFCSETLYGEQLRLVGSSKSLGAWNPFDSNAVPFSTSPETFPLWTSVRPIFIEPDGEFKLVIVGSQNKYARWEGSPNRTIPPLRKERKQLRKTSDSSRLSVAATDADSEGDVPISRLRMRFNDPNIQEYQPSCNENGSSSRQYYFDNEWEPIATDMKRENIFGPIPPPTDHAMHSAALAALGLGDGITWVGEGAEFARSRSELKSLEMRRLQFNKSESDAAAAIDDTDSDADDSQGIRPSIKPLIEGMATAHSFLEKLQLVADQCLRLEEFLSSPGLMHPVQTEQCLHLLTGISVYLTLIRTGAAPCTESGGHYRPCHHANAALTIFNALLGLLHKLEDTAWHLASNEYFSQVTGMLVRRILPLIPSFSDRFTCAVPLARIRDIAHRNDIPQDLKQEIKHTLQNKLHRSAGPEDLVAALAMHKRLLAEPWRYSPDFLNDFGLFVNELKEFFNANSLIDRLQQLVGLGVDISGDLNRAVALFIKERAALEFTTTRVDQLLQMMGITLSIRTQLQRFRHEKKGELPAADLQLVWLCDIGVEVVAFTVIGRITALTIDTISWGQLQLVDTMFLQSLEMMDKALQHIELNGIKVEECEALRKSISTLNDAVQDRLDRKITLRDLQLMARAVMERAQMLVDAFCDLVLGLYPPVARAIGRACRAAPHIIQVFAEADIRATMFYQLSRITSILMNQLGAALGETGVEIVVDDNGGSNPAIGKLVLADDLWQLPQLLMTDNSEPTSSSPSRGSKAFPGTVHDVIQASCTAVETDVKTAVAQRIKSKEIGSSNGAGKKIGPPKPIILVLRSATGDEEVSGLRAKYGVRGIILLQSVPHLSHLSIRARQEAMPFVCVVNSKCPLNQQVAKLNDCYVQMTFAGEGDDEDFLLKEAACPTLPKSPTRSSPTPSDHSKPLSLSETADVQPEKLGPNYTTRAPNDAPTSHSVPHAARKICSKDEPSYDPSDQTRFRQCIILPLLTLLKWINSGDVIFRPL